VSSVSQNSRSPLSRLKTVSYLNNILARVEAKAKEADEALLLNERNFLCEGSTSNVFLVSGGRLITPGVESGCLLGITRQVVIEIAQEMGMGVAQREIQLEELLRADEAFLSNSLIELMPLAKVNNKLIGEGRAGKVTQKLLVAYRKAVREEIKQGA
jgi:branched-subunit amino acid aminotransferase/4-amino-4-deoxychorismate lyase